MKELIYPNFPQEIIKSQEYLDQYIAFIDSRPVIKPVPFKTEWHHKIPDSLGGSNLDEHKIHLLHKDHWEAHRLLHKAIGKQMTSAFWYMNINKKYKQKLTAEQYAELKEKNARVISKRLKGRKASPEACKNISKSLMGHPGYMLGKKHSEETKAKMRAASTGKKMSQEAIDKSSKARTGAKRSAETCEKLSKAAQNRKPISEETRKRMSKAHKGQVGPTMGMKTSDETKAKISAAHKNKKKTLVTCPHCGKVGGDNVMTRWHFDNCKLKCQ